MNIKLYCKAWIMSVYISGGNLINDFLVNFLDILNNLIIVILAIIIFPFLPLIHLFSVGWHRKSIDWEKVKNYKFFNNEHSKHSC